MLLKPEDLIELAFFTLAVLGIVFFDGGFFASKNNANYIPVKSALKRVGFYVLLAFAFSIWVYNKHSQKEFFDFTTGYFLEMALSVDNVFVFILIFDFFKASNKVKQKILLFGVLGAFILRGIFIFLGVNVVHKFHWVLFVFGVVLLLSAIKILYIAAKGKEEQEDISKSKMLKLLSKVLPIAPNYSGTSFLFIITKNFTFPESF